MHLFVCAVQSLWLCVHLQCSWNKGGVYWVGERVHFATCLFVFRRSSLSGPCLCLASHILPSE